MLLTVQISSATRDLMLIQHNWIGNRSGVAELIWVSVQTSSACPDLPGTDWNQLNVCWCECFCTNFCWETSVFCLIGTPRTNMGFWSWTRLKQRKWKKYNENGQNDGGAPWQMNFKLNECQHRNCLWPKFSWISVKFTWTLHLHFIRQRVPLSYLALCFWVSGQFSNKPTRSQSIDRLVNLRTSQVAEMCDVKCTNK